MCKPSSPGPSRRDFLRASGACGAHLALAGVWAPRSVQELFAARPGGAVQAVEPWGRIERVAEGVWAVVSTPLRQRDFTTLSNGGIIAGRDEVLAVEGFASVEGASWVAAAAVVRMGLKHEQGRHAKPESNLERVPRLPLADNAIQRRPILVKNTRGKRIPRIPLRIFDALRIVYLFNQVVHGVLLSKTKPKLIYRLWRRNSITPCRAGDHF